MRCRIERLFNHKVIKDAVHLIATHHKTISMVMSKHCMAVFTIISPIKIKFSNFEEIHHFYITDRLLPNKDLWQNDVEYEFFPLYI